MNILYILVRPLIKLFVLIVYRPKIIGKSYIPNKGRVVLAGNHTNNLDCILLIASTKREIYFLAKDSLNKGLKGYLFRGMGIIPVNRSIHDKNALKSAEDILNKEEVIGIFPEGTINRTNDTIMPFKIGAVKMSKDTNSEIVPFTIKGEYKVFKNNLTLEFYKPIKITSDDLTRENEKLMNIIKNELEGKR